MKLVLDASVILKLVLVEKEQDQEIALTILKNFQNNKVDVVLPGIWVFEVGNTLIRKREEFEALFMFVLDIGFSTHEFSSNELIETGRFGKTYEVPFYDASYHYLARSTSSTFVTADEKYFEKVKKVGNIILLKNLKLY